MGNYLWPNGGTAAPAFYKDRGSGFRFTSPYGMRTHPVTGRPTTMHNGIDLIGFEWNCAPAAGRVIVAGPNGDAGWEVRIQHDDGNQTRQLHHVKNSLQVGVGSRVSAGQRLGRQGMTGLVTGVHDHFETYEQGRRIDPILFMQKYGAGGSPASVEAKPIPEEEEMAGPLFISPNIVAFPNGYTTSLDSNTWTALKARFEYHDNPGMDWATDWAVGLSWTAANFMQARQAEATAAAVRAMLIAGGFDVPTDDGAIAKAVVDAQAEIDRINAGVAADVAARTES